MFALVLAGCSPPGASGTFGEPAGDSVGDGIVPTRTTTRSLAHDLATAVVIGSSPLRSPPPPAVPRPPEWPASNVRPLVGVFEDASFDLTRGRALADEIEALPPERRALGVSGLASDGLFGEGGRCEEPHLTARIDGWDVTLAVEPTIWMTTPVRDVGTLSETCSAALLSAAGDVEGALVDCTDRDERSFFPEGSTCRACLELDGDAARCATEGECAAEATLREPGRTERGDTRLRARTLACAPDLELQAILLVPDLEDGDPLPPLWANGAYRVCREHWSAALDGPQLVCMPSTGLGHELLDVLPSRVHSVARPGSGGEGHLGRVSVVGGVETTDGRSYTTGVAYDTAIADITIPYDDGGWGFDPALDREGGGGTLARDWLAMLAMKLSSGQNGVIISVFDTNRCVSWDEPLADGSSTCLEMGPWTERHDDGAVGSWAYGGLYVLPLTTLTSTGLPDPTIPGGVVVQVSGSTTLETLEGVPCAWPDTFVPDRVRLFDSAPVTPPAYSAFDGQTWRFGRPGGPDVRLGLATNQRRGFCPGPAPAP